MKISHPHYLIILAGLLSLFFSCISPYEYDGIKSMEPVLVVDGIITNDTTELFLSWGVPVNSEIHSEDSLLFVPDAKIAIETNDGIRFDNVQHKGYGRYSIINGPLDKEKQYRLYISVNGEEYQSEFLSPLFTPEIDSLSWKKDYETDEIYICASTHDSQKQSDYYRWRYKEIWEFNVELFANARIENGKTIIHSLSENTYYCWGRDSSKIYILDSTEKLYENIISQKKLIKFSSSDERISSLYYIEVKQNQIRKEAYTYYSNIQRNIEQTGSIFSHIPGEINGNISCITTPSKLAIGYVEVSVTTIKNRFFDELINIYISPEKNCGKYFQYIRYQLPPGYAHYQIPLGVGDSIWAPIRCVDCRERGTKDKPSFWPTEHL